MKHSLAISLAIGTAMLTAPFATGSVVITPVGATSTTTIGGSRTIDAAIDGSSLSGGGTSGDILSELVANAGSSGHWLSAITAIDDDPNFRSTTEVLTFDLGSAFDVDAFHLWPYVRPERARGLSSFDLSFSTDGGSSYPTTITLSGWTIGPSSTSTGEPVETQTFALQSGVTHIRMTNLTTFGSTSYIGVAELRFGNTIPEPSGTLLLGIAGLAVAYRRKR